MKHERCTPEVRTRYTAKTGRPSWPRLGARLAAVLLLLQFHLRLLPAHFAESLRNFEIRFLGLQDLEQARARSALTAESRIIGPLSSWHSRATLLGEGKKCKANGTTQNSLYLPLCR